MQTVVTKKAEEWTKIQSSAFVFLSLIILLLLCVPFSIAQQSAESSIPVTGYPSFTPQNTIRCAEGELLLFWGENKSPIQPTVWQSPQPGKIVFSVQDEFTRLQIEAAFAETVSASQTVSGVIVQVTASRRTNQEANLEVWCAWRHLPKNGYETFGVLLANPVQEQIEVKHISDTWKDIHTWWFIEHAYCRGEMVLYWLQQTEGWNLAHYVRDPMPPYHSLEQQSFTGWTKFSAALKNSQPSSFQIVVPYSPVPVTRYTKE